jgi:hypothetical protein
MHERENDYSEISTILGIPLSTCNAKVEEPVAVRVVIRTVEILLGKCTLWVSVLGPPDSRTHPPGP